MLAKPLDVQCSLGDHVPRLRRDLIDHLNAEAAVGKRTRPLDPQMPRRGMLPAVVFATAIAVMVRVNDQDTGLAGGRGYALEVGDGIGRFRGFLGPFVKFPAGFEEFIQSVDQ